MTLVPAQFLALLSPWKTENGSVNNKYYFINNAAHHIISIFYHHLYILHFRITSITF